MSGNGGDSLPACQSLLKALALIVIVINVLDHSKHQGVVIILSHYNNVSLPIGTSFVGDLANSI